ncbi:MAG: ATP-binding cassette domain-containing protein [candidate division Zixibacteria bacterium]|nr:ATP-binding cassette domain-containing protein [candidate division Zixibacteria bacterium]
MIELNNVSFAYGDRPILTNVTFKIEQSESVVIMGPSGSGKSTILRLILGLNCPQRGSLLINGENICVMKEDQKREIRKGIGMVFQDGALFDSLTVGENVGYYLLEHTKMRWEEIEERVREMLGFVGLDADEIIDKLPEELSGGMQRRVAIGRALLSTNPRVMLYDEPTTGLDPQATETVLDLINKLTLQRKISTIVVTHEIADAFAVANRFMLIWEGELIFDGNVDQLRDSADGRVRSFLEPFRTSFNEVRERKFV